MKSLLDLFPQVDEEAVGVTISGMEYALADPKRMSIREIARVEKLQERTQAFQEKGFDQLTDEECADFRQALLDSCSIFLPTCPREALEPLSDVQLLQVAAVFSTRTQPSAAS